MARQYQRHGTYSRYKRKGCRCALCKAANRLYVGRWRRAKGIEERRHRCSHGSTTMYRHGCRCEPCREAAAEHSRDEKRRLRGKTPPRHGRRGYLVYGCRCDVCSAANAEACRAYYQKKKELAHA